MEIFALLVWTIGWVVGYLLQEEDFPKLHRFFGRVESLGLQLIILYWIVRIFQYLF